MECNKWNNSWFKILNVVPTEITKKIEVAFTAETLFTEIFRPHFKYFGQPSAIIDGVYLPEESEKRKGNFTLIDFSRSQNAGLNLLTIFAISAALQGSRISVTKKCDDWGIVKEERPISYDDSFKEKLDSWIKQAGEISAKTSFSEENKISFYLALSEMMNISLKGRNPGEAFSYVMDGQKNLRGFSIFSSFFPNISKKIDEEAIYTLLNNGYNFEAVLRGFVKNDLERFFDIDSGIELAFLLQFSPDTIETLVKLQKDHTSLYIDWSLSKEKIIEEINKIARGETIETVYVEKKEKTEGDFPNPEKFGMKVNQVETQLMKEHFKRPDAVVISPSEIRKNPAQFWEYQRALVLRIAERQRIKIDEGVEIPLPEGYDKKQEKSFRSTERLLKENSDWIWLFLYPNVQKEFFEKLPYLRVPPYLLINGEAVPVSDLKRRYYIVTKILENEKNVINRLPFLNFIDSSDVRKKRRVNTRHNLTIPGKLIKKFIGENGEKKVVAYLDHGIARWVFGTWGDSYELEPLGYVAYSGLSFDYTPNVDVDMLIFGVEKSIANIANNMVGKMNPNLPELLYSNFVLGLSMGKVDWTFIAKNVKNLNLHRIKNDTYMLAHSKACLVQALRGWQAGTPKQNTDLLVETLMGFSKIRTLGLLAELVTDSNGAEFFAVKPVDIFGGLMDYLEAGGGIQVEGKKKNVIRFISLDRAFSSDSVWHALRTIIDMVYTTGGAVILPEGNLEVSDKKIDICAVFLGIEQFREKLEPIYKYIEAIRNGDITLSDALKRDLRRELIKGTKGIIENNLDQFLTLCSDRETFDKENIVFGLEQSRLFPHLDFLEKNKEFWEWLRENVKTNIKQEGENSLHFLSRTILEERIDILSLIASHIRYEFRMNPLRIGWKLSQFESDYYEQESIIKTGHKERARWALLDSHELGLLASGTNTHKWNNLISSIKKGTIDITDELRSNTNIFNVLRKYAQWSFSVRDRKIYLPEGETLLSKITEDQINALADWLLDTGF